VHAEAPMDRKRFLLLRAMVLLQSLYSIDALRTGVAVICKVTIAKNIHSETVQFGGPC
jgi:hypothetical protein